MDFDKLFEELDLWKRFHPEEIGHRNKYQELFSEKKPLLFSSLRKIISGYYPVIIKYVYCDYICYRLEWVRQYEVINKKECTGIITDMVSPLRLLIPSIFLVIW